MGQIMKTVIVEASPTVTAGAYSANDLVGGILTFADLLGATKLGSVSRPSGTVISAAVMDLAGQDVDYELFLFSSNPSNGTYTDNAALTLHDSDAPMLLPGTILMETHYAFAASGVTSKENAGVPFYLDNEDRKLYGLMRTLGTPTYAATTDIRVMLGLLLDG